MYNDLKKFILGAKITLFFLQIFQRGSILLNINRNFAKKFSPFAAPTSSVAHVSWKYGNIQLLNNEINC